MRPGLYLWFAVLTYFSAAILLVLVLDGGRNLLGGVLFLTLFGVPSLSLSLLPGFGVWWMLAPRSGLSVPRAVFQGFLSPAPTVLIGLVAKEFGAGDIMSISEILILGTFGGAAAMVAGPFVACAMLANERRLRAKECYP